MLSSSYMILLTSFAIFGLYSFFDMVFMFFYLGGLPSSVTILKNQKDSRTMKKVKLLENTVPNNHIVFYPATSDNPSEEIDTFKDAQSFLNYIEEVLVINQE